jgi:UDP-N-acetylmuramate dehydrogenase
VSATRRTASVAAVIDPALARLATDLKGMPGVTVRPAEPMARHTTMRVGGPADVLVSIVDPTMLASVVRMARARRIPHLLVGRGSDLVVADAGIRGLVILCRNETWQIDGTRLIAGAGLPLARAATEAGRAGLVGLEFGVSIPGTVGGAIWANAGAHGSDVASVLESVMLLDAAGIVSSVPAADLGLSYRDSRLKRDQGWWAGAAGVAATAGAAALAEGPAEVVLEATFRLSKAEPADLAGHMSEIRRWRRQHQPLAQPSAGSVFRNPPDDSAGRLIEACGLKGAHDDGAEISELHANFIVNAGGATAAGVRRLGDRARAAVKERFGIELEYEVLFVGDWAGIGTEE